MGIWSTVSNRQIEHIFHIFRSSGQTQRSSPWTRVLILGIVFLVLCGIAGALLAYDLIKTRVNNTDTVFFVGG